MDTVKKLTAGLLRIAKSRALSTVVLAACSVAMIAYVSVNMRVYTVMDGTDSKVVLTLSDKPEDVVAAAGVVLKDGDELKTEAG